MEEIKAKLAVQMPKNIVRDYWYVLEKALTTHGARERESVLEEVEKLIHTDAVLKFNSTPEVGEKFDEEKHNHANNLLNQMTTWLLKEVGKLKQK